MEEKKGEEYEKREVDREGKGEEKESEEHLLVSVQYGAVGKQPRPMRRVISAISLKGTGGRAKDELRMYNKFVHKYCLDEKLYAKMIALVLGVLFGSWLRVFRSLLHVA